MLLVKYTLIYAVVLMLVALGGMYSERSGVINIALEGIMVVGGLMGVLAESTLAAGGRVTGVEINPAAVADARANAALNGLTNCAFVRSDLGADLASALGASPDGDAEDAFRADRAGASRPDVIVVDPPRAGLRPEVVRALLRAAPPRLIYVSCNPSTQARDVKLLRAAYAVSAVRPVDLFPQTPHVECVMRLDRVSP